MSADDSQSSRNTALLRIGLAVCGLMFLYPPWTEKPGQIWVGDYPVHHGGGEVDYVPEYKLDPKSPIRKNTEPEYRPLGSTIKTISWPYDRWDCVESPYRAMGRSRGSVGVDCCFIWRKCQGFKQLRDSGR